MMKKVHLFYAEQVSSGYLCWLKSQIFISGSLFPCRLDILLNAIRHYHL
jgi:hypothetical protein